MADINARLLQAIDGSAPQHKVRGQNRFEFSEGSDRTLHVKIAGKNGNPLDFEGDKFPVEDKQLQSVINELNKVKSELESIKNGTLKVKNDQLIDKIDALLAKQQSLEDKINSVMQGNAFRTQLTGSIIENDSIKTSITKNNSVRELLANTVVPAGGYVIVSAEFHGSRVGFGIRWEQTIPFRIRFQYEHLNTALSEQITLISRTHSRADGNLDLNLAKGSFIIWNDSQQDAIIRFFVISDFMGGSKNANSDQQFT